MPGRRDVGVPVTDHHDRLGIGAAEQLECPGQRLGLGVVGGIGAVDHREPVGEPVQLEDGPSYRRQLRRRRAEHHAPLAEPVKQLEHPRVDIRAVHPVVGVVVPVGRHGGVELGVGETQGGEERADGRSEVAPQHVLVGHGEADAGQRVLVAGDDPVGGVQEAAVDVEDDRRDRE